MNTTLILSVLVFMFFFARNPFAPSWPLVIMGAIALVSHRARYAWTYWLCVLAITTTLLALDWYQFSRTFLIFYWIIAITLAMRQKTDEDQQAVLTTNARFLLAGTMLVAVVSKILSPDYLNGRFFMSWMMLSHPTRDFAHAIIGISNDDFLANQSALQSVITGEALSQVKLAISPIMHTRLETVSMLFAWWGLVIELVIGLLFLFPYRHRLSQIRHALLILFCFTCYAILPVVSFALILIILGLAQVRADETWIRRSYFALVPIIFLFAAFPYIAGWSKIGSMVSRLLFALTP